MGDNKGFTFVELLATIVIIGILSIVALVAVNSVINSGKEKEVASSENMMRLSAKQYFADNIQKRPKVIGESATVSLKDLIDLNYIDKIYDSKKKECDSEKSYVRIVKEDKSEFTYDAHLFCENYGTENNKESDGPLITISNTDINKTINRTKKDNIYVNFYIEANNNVELKSYYYEIYRNTNISSVKWKIVKKSDNVSWKDNLLEKKNVRVSFFDSQDGEYRVVFYAIDSVGKTSKLAVRNLFIDTVDPVCSVTLDGVAGNNSWYRERAVKVNFSANDVANKSSDGNNYYSNLLASDLTTSETPSYLTNGV